ncbi:MAG TPA: helix-turn-helix domain-containing protein [Ktedonobacteraceae bacterium]|jgi:putative transposase
MSSVTRAYRCRVSPTDEQRPPLARTFGCTRSVYHWAHRLRIETFQHTGTGRSDTQRSAPLTTLNHQQETGWLKVVSCVPLQQGLRHLTRAFVTF